MVGKPCPTLLQLEVDRRIVSYHFHYENKKLQLAPGVSPVLPVILPTPALTLVHLYHFPHVQVFLGRKGPSRSNERQCHHSEPRQLLPGKVTLCSFVPSISTE